MLNWPPSWRIAFSTMCGIFGAFHHPDAARLTYRGLCALQHRGQESAGVVAAGAGDFQLLRGMGFVADALPITEVAALVGSAAIGHVRYSTTGGSTPEAAQPFSRTSRDGPVAVAHNGQFAHAEPLREQLLKGGAAFASAADTEVLLHLLAQPGTAPFEGRLASALARLGGAYSVAVLTRDALYLARDPSGYRPLAIGRLGDATLAASESPALDALGATDVRELSPGEFVRVDARGMGSSWPLGTATAAACSFELVYFARVDATVFGKATYAVRQRLGVRLAAEAPAAADVVVGVPESGIPAALGYAQALGLPFEAGLVRGPYPGRSFLEPDALARQRGVEGKLTAVRSVLRDRRVVVVDDSLVRGTTAEKVGRLAREAGAREVHLRIASPQMVFPCFFGIDTPSRAELLAAGAGPRALAERLGVDSVGYLSLAGLAQAVDPQGERRFCDACFSGHYRTAEAEAAAALPGNPPGPPAGVR